LNNHKEIIKKIEHLVTVHPDYPGVDKLDELYKTIQIYGGAVILDGQAVNYINNLFDEVERGGERKPVKEEQSDTFGNVVSIARSIKEQHPDVSDEQALEIARNLVAKLNESATTNNALDDLLEFIYSIADEYGDKLDSSFNIEVSYKESKSKANQISSIVLKTKGNQTASVFTEAFLSNKNFDNSIEFTLSRDGDVHLISAELKEDTSSDKNPDADSSSEDNKEDEFSEVEADGEGSDDLVEKPISDVVENLKTFTHLIDEQSIFEKMNVDALIIPVKSLEGSALLVRTNKLPGRELLTEVIPEPMRIELDVDFEPYIVYDVLSNLDETVEGVPAALLLQFKDKTALYLLENSVVLVDIWYNNDLGLVSLEIKK
jgi:hypothetical protein